jgi:hypothetical protein
MGIKLINFIFPEKLPSLCLYDRKNLKHWVLDLNSLTHTDLKKLLIILCDGLKYWKTLQRNRPFILMHQNQSSFNEDISQVSRGTPEEARLT